MLLGVITDLNMQAQQTETSFLVHPSELYVGCKHDRWAEKGKPLNLTTVVTDIDGNKVGGIPIEVSSFSSLSTHR